MTFFFGNSRSRVEKMKMLKMFCVNFHKHPKEVRITKKSSLTIKKFPFIFMTLFLWRNRFSRFRSQCDISTALKQLKYLSLNHTLMRVLINLFISCQKPSISCYIYFHSHQVCIRMRHHCTLIWETLRQRKHFNTINMKN